MSFVIVKTECVVCSRVSTVVAAEGSEENMKCMRCQGDTKILKKIMNVG